jgi:hypothetical protein
MAAELAAAMHEDGLALGESTPMRYWGDIELPDKNELVQPGDSVDVRPIAISTDSRIPDEED